MSQYYKWTVLWELPHGMCVCRCECGRIHKRPLRALKTGKSQQCKRCGIIATARHNKVSQPRHNERLYRIWCNMKSRCYNPNFPKWQSYGKLGVKVCDEWKNSYLSFKEWSVNNGYAPELSLDRIDVEGNYCPINCRWTTPHVQCCNQRLRKDSPCGYKGVVKQGEKYLATIRVQGHLYRLGIFSCVEEAVLARDKFILDNDLTEYELQILSTKRTK